MSLLSEKKVEKIPEFIFREKNSSLEFSDRIERSHSWGFSLSIYICIVCRYTHAEKRKKDEFLHFLTFSDITDIMHRRTNLNVETEQRLQSEVVITNQEG